MRGYTPEQALTIIKMLSGFNHKIGVEVTTNNPDYLKIIEEGTKKYGDTVDIGVGTVLDIGQARDAIIAGAQFMLGPTNFTPDIFELARRNNVITVPAAMSPTEILKMRSLGADIVKIFPAVTVQPKFFKQIQGPLGKMRLMAVGGVNIKNAKEFFDNGAGYLGIGSGMFNKTDVQGLNIEGLKKSVDNYVKII